MRIAYLTNQYPKVSHTFIRRELRALEDRGVEVMRSAIRGSGEVLADPEDQEEAGRTFVCLAQPKGRLLCAFLAEALRAPGRSLAALRLAWRLARKSDRGLGRHLAYWVEAHVLRREYRRRGVQHVHVHFATNAAKVARMVRAMGGPSYSVMVHGPDDFDAPRAQDLGGTIDEAAFATVISSYCGAQVRRWAPYRAWGRIHQVHCAVGEAFLDAWSPVAEEARSLVCIGRLAPQKGQLLLLEAWAAARDQGADLDLVLVGDGEMRPELEALAREKGVAAHLRITGWVGEKEVRAELEACRALALPSFAEGLPVVIMEAFALGRPAITTMIAGIPELVVAGDNGFLFPAGDVARITAAILEVAKRDAAALTAMGRHGHEAVRREHHQPTEAAKLHRHLEDALSGR
jgi:colanic acid/amylovoran biosynthesis glycosyltransferase